MASPSFFDWIAAFRHSPLGARIPWLDRHPWEELTAVPGSVLVLHLPSAGGSGPGHLVVAPDGDSAFITSSGTCWELGPLAHAVDEIHEGDDHTVQVFMSRPTSIHITFEADHGSEFRAVLRQIVTPGSYRDGEQFGHGSESGDEMGLFGRKAGSTGQPPVSFPAGQQPPPGTPLEQYLVHQALSTTPNSAIASEDVMAYADAGYATVLGVPENDQIIAWGDALIQTPEDSKAHQGTVVVTRNTMLAYWQPGRTSLIHTFQGNHSAVSGVSHTGQHSLMAQWEVAEYANNKGKFIVGSAPVILTAQLGKDGHANRRALTWFFTLAHLLDSAGGPSGSQADPPSGGLGSSGTKL